MNVAIADLRKSGDATGGRLAFWTMLLAFGTLALAAATAALVYVEWVHKP